MLRHSKIYVLLLICFYGIIYGQHSVVSNKGNVENATSKYKILIIPFEDKMYMSEVDYYIAKEEKLSQKQIRYKLKDGLSEQLFLAFKKKKFQVIDFMSDTLKYKADMQKVYGNITYEYQAIPNQDKYEPPQKEKKEKGITKGQVNAVSDNDNKFMNAKVLNPTLVPYLFNKYKTNIYVFINEFDFKASVTNPTDYSSENTKRKLIIHYTVYTVDAKEINSGIAEIEADVMDNEISKIQKKYITEVAEIIASRVIKILQPTTIKNTEKK